MRVYDRSVPPRSVLLTSSQKVTVGPALIVDAMISGSDSTIAARVYDGANALGTEKLHFDEIKRYSFGISSLGGIECLTGIYVAIDGDSTYLMLSYYPANEVASPA